MIGWTTCVFALDLSRDLKCSTEVVATIQAFLDVRLQALPASAKRAREEKVESQDEFGSLGFELDDTTLAQLGGEAAVDPVQKQDEMFATVSLACLTGWTTLISRSWRKSSVPGFIDCFPTCYRQFRTRSTCLRRNLPS